MISAALEGALDSVETVNHPVFGLAVPKGCNGVPSGVWDVRGTWSDPQSYDLAAQELAERFAVNFEQFESHASQEMKMGAPKVEVTQNI